MTCVDVEFFRTVRQLPVSTSVPGVARSTIEGVRRVSVDKVKVEVMEERLVLRCFVRSIVRMVTSRRMGVTYAGKPLKATTRRCKKTLIIIII